MKLRVISVFALLLTCQAANAVLPGTDTQGRPFPSLAPMLKQVNAAVVNIATYSTGESTYNPLPYRVAVGPQAGRKVFTLQTLPPCEPDDYADTAGKVSGFSLHAGVAARSDERKKLERLCRYISRPAVAEKRLSLTSNGNIRYQLKTPYRES